jgi:hypothetical protein
MAERRRPLTEGLKVQAEAPRDLEQKFVFGDKGSAPPELVANKPSSHITRVPLTTRIRADLAQAVKRATLERQLQGVEPNTTQEIIESAVEPWLRANGYIP